MADTHNMHQVITQADIEVSSAAVHVMGVTRAEAALSPETGP